MRPIAINTLATLTAVLGSSTLAAATVVESGHTAAWYDPARNGEGWVLEILNDDRAVVYWFTYDDEGGQRWMIGAGEVVEDEGGRYIEVPELVATHGARFGDAFDPDDVVSEVVGSASFRFDDCRTGTISYTAFGESSEASLQRLARTMGAGCSPLNGIPGEPVKDYAGQSGDWYDPSHNGEGFTMQWLTRDQALAYWFTYDDEGNQAWMFGVGNYVDGVIEFPTLQATGGARFGAGFDPDDVQLIDWGTMTMDLACDTGAMSYASELPAFGEGGQDLKRLSRLASPACPYVKPLLTDLYDAEWTEVPVPEDGSIIVRALADDGTVVGMRSLDENTGELVVMRPGASEWETLDGQTVWRESPVLVSPDAGRIVAAEAPDEDIASPFEPVAWWIDTGWEPVAGIDSPYSLLNGGSRDGNVLVGKRYTAGDPRDGQPWIWDPIDGQRALPADPDFENGYWPTTATADGAVAVGYRTVPVTTPVPPIAEQTGLHALRWVNEGQPEVLTDPGGTALGVARGCSTGCEVVFGEKFSALEVGDERLNKPHAWFWTPDGRFGLLEPISVGDFEHVPSAIDAAGTMIVGTAPSFLPLATPAPSPVQAIAWTQRTGTSPLVNLFTQQTTDGDDWNVLNYKSSAVDISSAGDRILVSLFEGRAEEAAPIRAGILKLNPKE